MCLEPGRLWEAERQFMRAQRAAIRAQDFLQKLAQIRGGSGCGGSKHLMSAAGEVGAVLVFACIAHGSYAALWSDPAHATKDLLTTDRIATLTRRQAPRCGAERGHGLRSSCGTSQETGRPSGTEASSAKAADERDKGQIAVHEKRN